MKFECQKCNIIKDNRQDIREHCRKEHGMKYGYSKRGNPIEYYMRLPEYPNETAEAVHILKEDEKQPREKHGRQTSKYDAQTGRLI